MDSFQLKSGLVNYEIDRNPEVTKHLLETIIKHTVPNPPNPNQPNPYSTARMPIELLYIKHFTKAARYLIEDTEEGKVDLTEFNWPTPTLSIEQLYILYWFNQRGVELIETKTYDQRRFRERDVQIMCGLFFSRKADIAFYIAKKSDKQSEKLSAAMLAYKDITDCINYSQKIDQRHVSYQYGRRGDIEIFLGKNENDTKKRVDWLERAYQDHIETKDRTAKIDPEHSVYQLSFMGNIAKQIADLVEEVSRKTFWLEKAYKDYTECIKKTESFNPRHAAATRGHKADIIKRLADTLTDTKLKCNLLERCYEEYSVTVKICEKIDMHLSGHQYGFMGECAKSIANLVDDKLLKIEWLERTYNCFSKSEERIKEENKKSAVYTLCLMADVALDLANLIEEDMLKRAWLEKAYHNRKESCQRLSKLEKEYNDSKKSDKKLSEPDKKQDEPDKKCEAFSLTLSGDIAKIIASIEPNRDEKIIWLEMALNEYLTGAEKVREFSEEHYAMTHFNAGIIAAELFKLNGEHFNTAISSYTVYANYFEANVDHENFKIYRRTMREIDKLKEIKRDMNSKKGKGNGNEGKYDKGHEGEEGEGYNNEGGEQFQMRQSERAKDISRYQRNRMFRRLRRAGMMDE
ncbi:hypothetical protein HY636_03190 [Candidatus Woesearchaeota archaeon]|nr:hypothetical protein [Candidatus Woesearchaeota archaeon]